MYFIRDAAGNAVRYEASLDTHSTTVLDLATLKALAVAEHDDTYLDGVYVTYDAALVQSSTHNHRWYATLALPTHPAFAQMQKWKSLTNISQKDLVRLLRTELSEYVDPTVIAKFATLKFTSNSEGTSSVRPASAALDTCIVRQVQVDAGGDVPETIKFHVPVYDIPEARGDQYLITVYVEYDHDQQKFQLLAVHNEVRAAQEEAIKEIIDDLTAHASSQWPVYFGKPS